MKKPYFALAPLALQYVLSLLSPLHLAAETPLADPFIPDGETATYRIVEGVQEGTFRETVNVTTEAGKEIYEMSYQSATEETETTMQREDMLPYSVRTVKESEIMTLSTSTRASLHGAVHSAKITILSLADLKYALRGFPFEKGEQDIEIAFLSGNNGGDTSDLKITVRSAGVERIAAGDKEIACYKLELKVKVTGIMRIMNSFIGKTWFWYSIERPHYLVAYESTSGFRGSPKTRIEIIDYSGWH